MEYYRIELFRVYFTKTLHLEFLCIQTSAYEPILTVK